MKPKQRLVVGDQKNSMSSTETKTQEVKVENRFVLTMVSILISGFLCAVALTGKCAIKDTCLSQHDPASCQNIGLIF